MLSVAKEKCYFFLRFFNMLCTQKVDLGYIFTSLCTHFYTFGYIHIHICIRFLKFGYITDWKKPILLFPYFYLQLEAHGS